MKLKSIINFSDQQQKRRLLAQLGALAEPHEIELKPYRPRRSNRANSFYWSAVNTAFVQFAKEQGQTLTPDQAHDILVRRVLGEFGVVMPGGEVVMTRPDTHTLNTAEFSEFVEKAIAWLADYGIEVPVLGDESWKAPKPIRN